MPGGRSPGFLTGVVDPLVSAYVAEIERGPFAPGRSRQAHTGISSRVLAAASEVTMDSAPPGPYFVR